MAGGRPLKFQSVEELQTAIDAYFAQCLVDDEPLTITGLALALDTTRKTLIEYEGREEFVNTIKKAKTRVENYAEKRLFSGNATGPIFALKNFDWTDKQTVAGDPDQPMKHEHSGKIELSPAETYLAMLNGKS